MLLVYLGCLLDLCPAEEALQAQAASMARLWAHGPFRSLRGHACPFLPPQKLPGFEPRAQPRVGCLRLVGPKAESWPQHLFTNCFCSSRRQGGGNVAPPPSLSQGSRSKGGNWTPPIGPPPHLRFCQGGTGAVSSEAGKVQMEGSTHPPPASLEWAHPTPHTISYC